jgi:protein-S-isoprenylcysteine O-methyltransferase Ste14
MDSTGVDAEVVCALLTVSTAVPFVLFASAGWWFFSGDHKGGTKLLSTASLLAFAAVIYSVWSRNAFDLWSALGVLLQSLSVFLFGWAIGTSARRNLGLAFANSASSNLVTQGPYALVRHPLYTAYIMFWLGGLAVASSIFTLVAAIVMLGIYIFAARSEDKVLANLFKDEFVQWRQATGAFFPKWH